MTDAVILPDPGDFVQFNHNFGDIFFEVKSILLPLTATDTFWSITYWTYGKYGSQPYERWNNSGGPGIRRIIRQPMATAVIQQRCCRFHAQHGQYDPIYGFAPAGTPLRRREDKW